MFELKARFGKSLVSCLGRVDGRTVGVIANNPKFKGGSIDVDACAKATSFLVLCDSFNIPIVFLVDQPGFLIGIDGEKRGAPGRIMNWMNALSLVSVPRISITLRKNYGQAYLNMGGGRNSDEVGGLAKRRLRLHGPGDRRQRPARHQRGRRPESDSGG